MKIHSTRVPQHEYGTLNIWADMHSTLPVILLKDAVGKESNCWMNQDMKNQLALIVVSNPTHFSLGRQEKQMMKMVHVAFQSLFPSSKNTLEKEKIKKATIVHIS